MPDAVFAAGDFSSQARYLFARFTGPDGLANVRALVGQTPRTVETNWLEFKSGTTKAERVKTLWSKALGSFANSGGGVVIWGIYAARDLATGVDAVQEEQSVPDVEKLVSRLKEYQPAATDPPIRGVEIVPLLLSGSSSEGFVVCLIPESDSKPHRSEFGDGDVRRFNLRIGDTTQECTVPILRQLFYPQFAPRLKATLNIRPKNELKKLPLMDASPDLAVLSLSLFNDGPVTMSDVFLRLRCDSTPIWMDGCERVWHPLACERITETLHPSLDLNLVLFVVESPFVLRHFNWEITVFARDTRPLHGVIRHADLLNQPGYPRTVYCVPGQVGGEGREASA